MQRFQLNSRWAIEVTIRVCMVLGMGIGATLVLAQPSSSMSAFMVCVNDDGSSGLCTVHGWDWAEGYSAEQWDGVSTLWPLGGGATSELSCVGVADLSAIAVELGNTTVESGDRIYLEDFLIVAIDDEENLLPEVPVKITVMAQDGMLLSDPQWNYVEINSFGYATFMVQSACPGAVAIGSDVSIQVNP